MLEQSSSVLSRNARSVRAFVAWQRDQRHRTPHTLYTYTTTLHTFVCFVGETSLDRVGLATIEGWLQRPRREPRWCCRDDLERGHDAAHLLPLAARTR